MADAIRILRSNDEAGWQEGAGAMKSDASRQLPKFKIARRKKLKEAPTPHQKALPAPQMKFTPMQKFTPMTTQGRSCAFSFQTMASSKSKRLTAAAARNRRRSQVGTASPASSRAFSRSKEPPLQEPGSGRDGQPPKFCNDSLMSSKHQEKYNVPARHAVSLEMAERRSMHRSFSRGSRSRYHGMPADKVERLLLSKKSQKKYQRMYYDILEELMQNKGQRRSRSGTRRATKSITQRLKGLITMFKEEVEEPRRLRGSHRKFKLRDSAEGSIESLRNEQSQEQSLFGAFDDTYLVGIQPLLPKAQLKILKSMRSRALAAKLGLGLTRTSMSTPRLEASFYANNSPSPLRTLTKPASGRLLSAEERGKQDKENVVFMNRLFRIICRDNQHAGFLKARGDFETHSSDEADEEEMQEKGKNDNEAKRKRSRLSRLGKKASALEKRTSRSKVKKYSSTQEVNLAMEAQFDIVATGQRVEQQVMGEGRDAGYRTAAKHSPVAITIDDQQKEHEAGLDQGKSSTKDEFHDPRKSTASTKIEISQADLLNKSAEFRQPNKLQSYLKNVKPFQPIEEQLTQHDQPLYFATVDERQELVRQTPQVFALPQGTKAARLTKKSKSPRNRQFVSSPQLQQRPEQIKNAVDAGSNGDSTAPGAQLQEMASAPEQVPIPLHPMVRSIEVNEWRQPQLLMTSIGEQEKDEEHDEASDILRINQNDSNLTHKFMTIQIGSEAEVNEKYMQHDISDSNREQAAHSMSNRHKTKMSTLNTATDRHQQYSRVQTHGDPKESIILSDAGRPRQDWKLARVNSLEPINKSRTRAVEAVERSPSTSKPHTSQQLARGKKQKQVHIKIVQANTQPQQWMSDVDRGNSFDEKTLKDGQQEQEQNLQVHSLQPPSIQAKGQSDITQALTQGSPLDSTRLGKAEYETNHNSSTVQRFSPSPHGEIGQQSIFSNRQNQRGDYSGYFARPSKGAKGPAELRRSLQHSVDYQRFKKQAPDDPYVQYARNHKVLKQYKDVAVRLKERLQVEKYKQMAGGVPAGFNHKQQSLMAGKRTLRMPSIGVKKQLMKPSTAILGNQSRDAEAPDSSSYAGRQDKAQGRSRTKRHALQTHDSSLEGQAQTLGRHFQPSPRLATGGRSRFDTLPTKSFAHDPVAGFYYQKMKFNMQSLERKSSNYLSVHESGTAHVNDLPMGERTATSVEQARLLKPKHAPKILSPLRKRKEDMAQPQALPNYKTSFGHHANDLGHSSLLLPANPMANATVVEPLSAQSASLDQSSIGHAEAAPTTSQKNMNFMTASEDQSKMGPDSDLPTGVAEGQSSRKNRPGGPPFMVASNQSTYWRLPQSNKIPLKSDEASRDASRDGPEVPLVGARARSPGDASLDMVGSLTSIGGPPLASQEQDKEITLGTDEINLQDFGIGGDRQPRVQTSHAEVKQSEAQRQRIKAAQEEAFRRTPNNCSSIKATREMNSRMTNPMEMDDRETATGQRLNEAPFFSHEAARPLVGIISSNETRGQRYQQGEDKVRLVCNQASAGSSAFDYGGPPSRGKPRASRGTHRVRRNLQGLENSGHAIHGALGQGTIGSSSRGLNSLANELMSSTTGRTDKPGSKAQSKNTSLHAKWSSPGIRSNARSPKAGGHHTNAQILTAYNGAYHQNIRVDANFMAGTDRTEPVMLEKWRPAEGKSKRAQKSKSKGDPERPKKLKKK